MSEPADDFFAPPPFKADEALVGLRRQLRELRPLAERGTRFELGGRAVIELAVEAGAIQARLARRPAVTPEWERLALKSSAEVRKFADEVKKRLTRWQDDER